MENDNEGNVIFVSIQKNKKNFVTVLQPISEDRRKTLLKSCKESFGCGGNIENDKIILYGEHIQNVRKNEEKLFPGVDLKYSSK